MQKINLLEISWQFVPYYTSATRRAGLLPQPTRCESETRRRPASISTHGQAHEQVGESLRRLSRQARSCFPSSLGPSLLPQSLQGQLSCKISARPCAHEKVVRLLCSRNDVARVGTPSGPLLIRAGYDTSRAGHLLLRRLGAEHAMAICAARLAICL